MGDQARDVARIAADLTRLGVGPDMLVMVHASLREVGPVIGSADGVIDAIREAIGSTGTMLMLLGAHDEWAWVNERPEAERVALLQDAEPFDAVSTPADPEVGVLAEVFRQRPETIVSDHPEGRFAAAGPMAPELLEDVPWNDYFAAGSPLERFVEGGGRVLRLGPDMNTTTVLHYAESLTSIEPKRRARRYRLVSTTGTPQVCIVDTIDDSEGIVDYLPGRDYFEDILMAYLHTGRARRGVVGDAESELLDAPDLVRFAVDWMSEHLSPG